MICILIVISYLDLLFRNLNQQETHDYKEYIECVKVKQKLETIPEKSIELEN